MEVVERGHTQALWGVQQACCVANLEPNDCCICMLIVIQALGLKVQTSQIRQSFGLNRLHMQAYDCNRTGLTPLHRSVSCDLL